VVSRFERGGGSEITRRHHVKVGPTVGKPLFRTLKVEWSGDPKCTKDH
jgi:hypothetical protein